MTPTRSILSLTLLATAFGCQKNRTEIVLGMATDLNASTPLSSVELQVFSLPSGVLIADQQLPISGTVNELYELPGTYAVYSASGSADRFRALLTATDNNGKTLVVRSAVMSLVPGKTLFARLGLVSACEGMTDCGAGQTCIEGHCALEDIDASRLPAYTPGMENQVDCASATMFVDTSTKKPLEVTGTSCPPGGSCLEGVCLTPPQNDGGGGAGAEGGAAGVAGTAGNGGGKGAGGTGGQAGGTIGGAGGQSGAAGSGNIGGAGGQSGAAGSGNIGGSGATGGGGATGTGNVGGSGAGGGAAAGTIGTCNSGATFTPAAPLITDFSDATPDPANPGDFTFGTTTGEMGGTSLFSNSTVGTLQLTGTGADAALVFSATVPTAGTASYNGFNIYVDGPACLNASAYSGVSFTIGALTGDCQAFFSFDDADHNTASAAPNADLCTGNCYPSEYLVSASTTSVPFAGATPTNPGSPVAAPDPSKLTGVQWLFHPAVGAASCTGSITVDNIAFY